MNQFIPIEEQFKLSKLDPNESHWTNLFAFKFHMDQFLDRIRVTYGPKGSNVTVMSPRGIEQTKDGASVLRDLTLNSAVPHQYVPLRLLKDGSTGLAELNGDGTSTYSIIAKGILDSFIENTEMTCKKSLRILGDEIQTYFQEYHNSEHKETQKSMRESLYRVRYFLGLDTSNDPDIWTFLSDLINNLGKSLKSNNLYEWKSALVIQRLMTQGMDSWINNEGMITFEDMIYFVGSKESLKKEISETFKAYKEIEVDLDFLGNLFKFPLSRFNDANLEPVPAWNPMMGFSNYGEGVPLPTGLNCFEYPYYLVLYSNPEMYLESLNMNAVEEGIKTAVKLSEGYLKAISSKKVTNSMLRDIAKTSTKEEEISKLVADVYCKYGKEAYITVEKSKSDRIILEESTGYIYERGVFNPAFYTSDTDKMTILEDANVVLCRSSISTDVQMHELLERWLNMNDRGKSLLIIARDFSQSVTQLVLRNMNSTPALRSVCLIPLAGLSEETKIASLEDLVHVMNPHLPEKINPRDLTCDAFGLKVSPVIVPRVIVREFHTEFSGLESSKESVERAKDRLTKRLENPELSNLDRTHLRERIAKFGRSTVTFKVGGLDDAGIADSMARFDDCIGAIRCAFKGILPGGSTAYTMAASYLSDIIYCLEELGGYNADGNSLVNSESLYLIGINSTDIDTSLDNWEEIREKRTKVFAEVEKSLEKYGHPFMVGMSIVCTALLHPVMTLYSTITGVKITSVGDLVDSSGFDLLDHQAGVYTTSLGNLQEGKKPANGVAFPIDSLVKHSFEVIDLSNVFSTRGKVSIPQGVPYRKLGVIDPLEVVLASINLAASTGSKLISTKRLLNNYR